jgi:hypothetical protein
MAANARLHAYDLEREKLARKRLAYEVARMFLGEAEETAPRREAGPTPQYQPDGEDEVKVGSVGKSRREPVGIPVVQAR